ncbi:MAG: hypothetical protein J0H62_11370, partial [Rhizobiales bacterium]|nr:hypothetical protein [Hyphomicrobiales bacterium]
MCTSAAVPGFTPRRDGSQDRRMIRDDKSPARAKKAAAGRLPLAASPKRPTFTRERRAMARGVLPIAGCDEVGRGPLAGPVVAAAVIL